MKIKSTLLFIILGFNATSQQDILSTMFWNNYAHFNPATTGLEYQHQANFTYRNQWVAISGSPNAIRTNYNTRLGHNHGAGINYEYDQVGYSKSHNIQLNYNYQFQVDRHRRISIGVSPGYIHRYVDVDKMIFPTDTPEPNPFDVRSNYFNFNAGLAYSGKNLYGGFGVTRVLSYEETHENGMTSFQFVRHYYAHLRDEIHLNRKLKVYLEGLFRKTAINYTFDLNARAVIWNKLMIGTGYRFGESFIFHAGWDIKEKFRLAYSYDMPHQDNKLASVSAGSHEFTLGYQIPFTMKKRRPIEPMPDF